MTHLEGHRSALPVTEEQKREATSIAPLSRHAWPLVFLEKTGVAMLLSLIVGVEGSDIPGLQRSVYPPLPPNVNGGPPCPVCKVENCK
jgi:hypothetical protein